jgi:enoyl-CoA hydratase
MTDTIQLSGGDHVTTVTVTEPHSLRVSFLQSLLKILTEKMGSSTRVLILTASHPEALLADVAVLKAMGPTEASAFSELGQKVCAAIEALPFPVIAAIDGLALGGGCELTLASDLVYASNRAQFGQIEVHGGVIPGFGGTWRLSRRVGDCKARELLYTGAVLDAHAARSAGLVTDVVDGAELLDRASAVATTIVKIAPLAVRAVKMLTLANRDLSLQDSNALERQTFASLFGTADQKEGMSAFLENRPAQFQGV